MKPSPAYITGERGFSIIETIVAMVVLATVISAGAYASIVNDSILSSERARSQKVQVAQKALSRIEGDLVARRDCNRGWRGQDRNASYGVCNIPINDMTDSDRRQYVVNVGVQPIDDPDDGLGSNDADQNARDHYKATVRVRYNANSMAGASGPDANSTYVVTGRLDWGAVTKGSGTVLVHVCTLDRPDRAYGGGRCGTDDDRDGAEPESGVAVTLVPQEGSDPDARSRTVLTDSDPIPGMRGVAAFRDMPPGNYRIQDPSLPGQAQLHRVSPRVVSVTGPSTVEATVIATHPGNVVNVCARISTPPDPDGVDPGNPANAGYNYPVTDGYGYEADSTNFSWHQVGGRVRKGITLHPPRNPRLWRCHGISDPLGYTTEVYRMFRGQYGLETQEVPGSLTLRDKGLPPVPGSTSHRYYMVRGTDNLAVDPNGSVCDTADYPAWPTAAYGVNSLQEPGTVLPNAMAGAVNWHKDGAQKDNQRWYSICLDFDARPVYDQICQQLTWPHEHRDWHWHSWGWHDHGSNHVHADGSNHWHPDWHEHGTWHEHVYDHPHNYDPPRWPPECFRRPDGEMVRLLSQRGGRNPAPVSGLAAQDPIFGGARRAL